MLLCVVQCACHQTTLPVPSNTSTSVARLIMRVHSLANYSKIQIHVHPQIRPRVFNIYLCCVKLTRLDNRDPACRQQLNFQCNKAY